MSYKPGTFNLGELVSKQMDSENPSEEGAPKEDRRDNDQRDYNDGYRRGSRYGRYDDRYDDRRGDRYDRSDDRYDDDYRERHEDRYGERRYNNRYGDRDGYRERRYDRRDRYDKYEPVMTRADKDNNWRAPKPVEEKKDTEDKSSKSYSDERRSYNSDCFCRCSDRYSRNDRYNDRNDRYSRNDRYNDRNDRYSRNDRYNDRNDRYNDRNDRYSRNDRYNDDSWRTVPGRRNDDDDGWRTVPGRRNEPVERVVETPIEKKPSTSGPKPSLEELKKQAHERNIAENQQKEQDLKNRNEKLEELRSSKYVSKTVTCDLKPVELPKETFYYPYNKLDVPQKYMDAIMKMSRSLVQTKNIEAFLEDFHNLEAIDISTRLYYILFNLATSCNKQEEVDILSDAVARLFDEETLDDGTACPAFQRFYDFAKEQGGQIELFYQNFISQIADQGNLIKVPGDKPLLDDQTIFVINSPLRGEELTTAVFDKFPKDLPNPVALVTLLLDKYVTKEEYEKHLKKDTLATFDIFQGENYGDLLMNIANPEVEEMTKEMQTNQMKMIDAILEACARVEFPDSLFESLLLTFYSEEIVDPSIFLDWLDQSEETEAKKTGVKQVENWFKWLRNDMQE